jgi:hypothetical protein
MAPRLLFFMSSGSKKKEPGCACRSEAKVSQSQRVWAEVSSSVPHFLHSELSDSSISCRYLLRVLRPVRRPVTSLDCVLLKGRNLALAPRQGPEIDSRACLWVSPRSNPALREQMFWNGLGADCPFRGEPRKYHILPIVGYIQPQGNQLACWLHHTMQNMQNCSSIYSTFLQNRVTTSKKAIFSLYKQWSSLSDRC